jgi:hypothetical protein
MISVRLVFSKTRVKLLVSLFVAFLPVLPQVWAFLRTPEGKFFLGVNTSSNLADIFGVYLSAIRNFSQPGTYLFYNPYTTQSSFFHYPVYLILGKIVEFTGFSVQLIYIAGIFVLSFIFSLLIFKIVGLFFTDFKRQLLAFGLVVFGGFLIYSVPEASGFLSLWEPHFIAAQISLFGLLYFLVLFSKKNYPLSYQFLFFLSTLSLVSIHPWMAVLLGIFAISWGFILTFSKKLSGSFIIAILILGLTSIPFLLYYADPSRIYWSSFWLPTPYYLPITLYGLLIPLTFVGLMSVRKEYKLPALFLSFWLIFQAIFIYLPLPFQRRFIEGFYLPVGVFSVFGIDWLIKRFNLRKLTNLIYICSFFYLSLGVWASYIFLFYWVPNEHIYRSVEEKEAWIFLDGNALPTERLFSLPFSGHLIPMFADTKIFAGHGIQTPDFDRKNEITKKYFGGALDITSRESLLKDENICYVYVGPKDAEITKLDFSKEDYLLSFFSNGEVSIYRTKWCNDSKT